MIEPMTEEEAAAVLAEVVARARLVKPRWRESRHRSIRRRCLHRVRALFMKALKRTSNGCGAGSNRWGLADEARGSRRRHERGFLHVAGVHARRRVSRIDRLSEHWRYGYTLAELRAGGFIARWADELRRDLPAVHLGQVALDLADRHAAGVHGDDLLVEAGPQNSRAYPLPSKTAAHPELATVIHRGGPGRSETSAGSGRGPYLAAPP